MFQNPFSFEGRIRRSEYGFSVIISAFISFIISAIIGSMGQNGGGGGLGFIYLFLSIPIWWFNLAQAVKRSHDTGNTGWMVLIPFYGLYLLFADGDVGSNQYGEDPKGRANNNPTINGQFNYSGGHNSNPTSNSIHYNGGHNSVSTPQQNNVNHSPQQPPQQNRTGFNGNNPYSKN